MLSRTTSHREEREAHEDREVTIWFFANFASFVLLRD
jgi:hypothetical protein